MLREGGGERPQAREARVGGWRDFGEENLVVQCGGGGCMLQPSCRIYFLVLKTDSGPGSAS